MLKSEAYGDTKTNPEAKIFGFVIRYVDIARSPRLMVTHTNTQIFIFTLANVEQAALRGNYGPITHFT